ncbi:hypothetical protein P6U16_08550 [Rhizobium sp. 32-5/1]|uniref:hypothetical protein n=1 Tax=Rhizobium sp. 32-5/1 TaxID=3019602 RepID=UPI00240D6272|nr:hypothetical protein [Rhizobium sp. 32-5/1]WEZ84608.1 hypothetical protein P6U16_08550 [Rhizobium sp. 32-5/1]
MAVFTKTVTIDFANPRQKSIRDWLEATGLKAESLPSFNIDVSINADIKEFDPDEIADRYEDLFPIGDEDTQLIERAYRYLAEGDVPAAMEELAAGFGLAPQHALALANLLTGGSNNVQG